MWKLFPVLRYNIGNRGHWLGADHLTLERGGGGGWFWKKISCKRLSEEKNCMLRKCNRKLMEKKCKKYPAHQIARKNILDDQKSPPPPSRVKWSAPYERCKNHSWKQRCCRFCWKLPDRAQSLVFCSQIVTEKINAMFLLVSKFKMIGMLLNVVHGQVHKKTYKNI